MGCIQSKNVITGVDGDETAYLSRFLEDRVLGEGEFGQVKLVYEASAPDSDPLACKMIKKGYTFKNNTILSPVRPEILQRETAILKMLKGKRHTLELVALYESSNDVFMVTEFCGGGEMLEWIVNKKTDELRTEDVSRIAYELLDSVDYCHSLGIIHRDIKPQNIMFKNLDDDSSVRLIDFGSGTFDSMVEGPSLDHHTFAGSAFYISPEMFLQLKKTDKTPSYSVKTDIWSVGVTLYVLVAGYPADLLQRAFNVLQKPPSQSRDLRKLPNLPDNLPDSFFDLLESCLNYKHKARSPAADLMKHEFVQFHKLANLPTDVEGNDDAGEVEEEEEGIDLSDVIAAAGGGKAVSFPDDIPTPSNKYSKIKSYKDLTSRSLKGSVQRHSMYANWAKFERSVTTLLATVLSQEEYDELINKLDEWNTRQVSGEEVDNNLKVIKMKELKALLRNNGQGSTVEMLSKLAGSFLYEEYAYHISKLRLFSTKMDKYNLSASGHSLNDSAHSAHRRSLSNSEHKAQQSNKGMGRRMQSVHGNDVWSSWAKGDKKKGGRASMMI